MDQLRKRFDPKTATGVALIVATVFFLVSAVGIGLVVVMIRSHAGLAALDLKFARYGAAHASDSSNDRDEVHQHAGRAHQWSSCWPSL